MATASARIKSPSDTLLQQVRCARQLIGARKAAALLHATDYPFQRPLRPWHVAEQRYYLEHGLLRIGMELHFAVFEKTGQRYQVNGRHTLTAVAESGKSHLFVIIEHLVTTEDEVAKLYATFDQHLKRSWRNIYLVEPVFQAQGLPAAILEKLGGVTNLLATGFRQEVQYPGKDGFSLLKIPEIRIALMESWLPEIKEMLLQLPPKRKNQAYAQNRHLVMDRSSVLALALITYRFEPGLAAQFWPALVNDSGLQEGDPARALLYYLRLHGTRQVDIPTYTRVVASAWNHFVQERALRELPGHAGTVRPASMPLLLAKTPHDGEGHYGYLGTDGTIWKKNPHRLDLQTLGSP